MEYTPLKNSTIQGLGLVSAKGQGTVAVKFALGGKHIRHTLRNVLHVPDAPNCLLSVPRLDEGKGHVEFNNGTSILKDKNGSVIGKGHLIN